MADGIAAMHDADPRAVLGKEVGLLHSEVPASDEGDEAVAEDQGGTVAHGASGDVAVPIAIGAGEAAAAGDGAGGDDNGGGAEEDAEGAGGEVDGLGEDGDRGDDRSEVNSGEEREGE